MFLQCVKQFRFMTGLLVSALPGFFRLFDASSHQFHIGHDEFQIDGLHIPFGICGTFHVDHVLIIEAAYHMNDGIRCPDIIQEFVSQTFSLGCAFHQSGNVHKLDDGVCFLLRMIHVCQIIQSCIRHRHHAHIGLDGTERIVCRFCTGVGDCIE